MALKYELEQWGEAVAAYDEQDFEKALKIFETIADSAKFHFNMGLIYATLGEHEQACICYKEATNADTYFAAAYFQKGVSHFLLLQFDAALSCFNNSLLYLRGNMLIDYGQLGLKFRLYSCEVLFNRGLCYLYLGQTEKGMNDLAASLKEKQTEEHEVINEAIGIQGQGFTVFSIPVGVIYRPAEGKLKNAKTKDYLGKAKLVAAVDPEDAFVGFTGAQKKQNAELTTTNPVKKDKTDGKVDKIGLRPPSPTLRPRSLSSNPKQPPFPVRGRNLSLRRNISRKNSPSKPTHPNFGNDETNSQQTYPERLPTSSDSNTNGSALLSRFGSLRKPIDLRIHHRSNTIDSGRPSPKLPPGPQRQSSMKNISSNNKETHNIPQRQYSLRNTQRSPSREKTQSPQRQGTLIRTQFLQKQIQAQQIQSGMAKMTLSDEPNNNIYIQYHEEPESMYSNINGAYNQAHHYASKNEEYHTGEDRHFHSSALNGDGNGNGNGNGNGSNTKSPLRSQSVRRRNSPPQVKGPSFKPSPLRENSQSGLLTPPSPPTSEQEFFSYVNLKFGKESEEDYEEEHGGGGSGGENDYQYGEEIEAQFEMVSDQAQKFNDQQTFNESSFTLPAKIKIKCYYKDTRAILVPSTINFTELLKRIQEKFGPSSSPFRLKYKDEDGEMVMMTDQEDLEMALGMANVKDDIGRLEISIEYAFNAKSSGLYSNISEKNDCQASFKAIELFSSEIISKLMYRQESLLASQTL
ncbi:hypothetical protein G9A89_017501 [Geosiphon pyriformis]|nr:hypothetical protein G9A89_017501 [Geosiphon pyriformis]